jgi:pimeloyl-ACP methyl ester carboxylesterase
MAIVADCTSPSKHPLVLHGIYGRRRNWTNVARRTVAARPDWALELVDLRLHGDSPPMAPPHTVQAAARDLVRLTAARPLNVTAVAGHSFGGKVALALAAEWRERPLQVWVLDSTPEARAPVGSAWAMLEAVRAMPRTFASREEAMAGLEARGFSRAVAMWMTSNLAPQGGAFRWQIDFTAMETLLRDFFATDLWRVVEPPAATHDVHVVKARESSALSPDAVARIERTAAVHPNVHLHHIAGGHWVNTENPDAVVELLTHWLP